MKNFVLLLLIGLSLASCEDTEINEFTMQAKIGDQLYTSSEAHAFLAEDGSLVIQGSSYLESLTLNLSRLKVGNYTIGDGSTNSAEYTMDGNIYKTNPNGTGLISISSVNEGNKTINGTFRFNAILPGIDTVYVSKGVLYNISYDNGQIGNPANAGTFSAKVDGEVFLPTVVSANETSGSIKISGNTLTAKITIQVPSNLEIGGHLLSENGYSAVYQDETGAQVTSEGSISIANHNSITKTIKGTFSFLTEQSEITEGQFEVVYE